MLGTGGHCTNEEEWRPASEDGGGFKVVLVQVNKGPYPVETFICWEPNRGISVGVVEVCELGDTAFVEKDRVGSGNLQYCGELERETEHEEDK